MILFIETYHHFVKIEPTPKKRIQKFFYGTSILWRKSLPTPVLVLKLFRQKQDKNTSRYNIIIVRKTSNKKVLRTIVNTNASV